MKLSVYDEPGYERVCGNCMVLCDGKPLEFCTRVDTDAGIATVHRKDANGCIIMDGDEWVEFEVRGKMEVVPMGRVTVAM